METKILIKSIVVFLTLIFFGYLYNPAFAQKETTSKEAINKMRIIYNDLENPEITFNEFVRGCSSFYESKTAPKVANTLADQDPYCTKVRGFCTNGDFESGLDQNQYVGAYGIYTPANLFPDPFNLTYGFLSGHLTTVSAHQTIVDTFTKDPYTNINLAPPNGGKQSLRLGNSNWNYGTELIAKTVFVDPNETILNFYYSVVFQDPHHFPGEQPAFSVRVYDCLTGLEISNVCNLGNDSNVVVSNSQNPFFKDTADPTHFDPHSPFPPMIAYRDWTLGQINLSQHIGKKVIIVFTNKDCGQGGHFGYTYIDNLFSSQCPLLGIPNTNQGSLQLDTSQGKTDSCGTGKICAKYTLPIEDSSGVTTSGTIQIKLYVYQNQNNSPVDSIISPLLTQDSTYCFNVNTTAFNINSALGGFDYILQANFTLLNYALASLIVGNPPTGQKSGINNDYRLVCTAPNCTGDNIMPVISCPADIRINNDARKCGANIAIINATATDNCSVDGIVGIRSDAHALSAEYPVGTTTITWTATDVNGLTATCNQTVTVTDNELPIIACPADINVNNDADKCGASVVMTNATAADNCGVDGIVGIRSDVLALSADYPVGTTIITWTATDVNGLTETCTQTIKVTSATSVCGSGQISGIPANSLGYAYNIFTAPTSIQSVIIMATVKWDSDWHIPGPNDNTNSFPHIVEIPYLGGNGCDNIYEHPSNNYVELGALNPADQFATITRSLNIGPGKSVAIAGSDCGLSDNISFRQVVTWEAKCIPLTCGSINLYVNDNSTTGDVYTTAIGNDATGNGSTSAPYRTINKAMSVAVSGDIIWADAGNYNEYVNVTKSLSIYGSNATISPNGGARNAESVITAAIPLGASGPIAFEVHTSGTDVKIKGFTIQNSAPLTDGHYDRSLGQNINVLFEKNRVQHGTNLFAGTLTPWKTVTITDNLFESTDLTSTSTPIFLQDLETGIEPPHAGTMDAIITDNVINSATFAGMILNNLLSASVLRNKINNTTRSGIAVSGRMGNVTISQNEINLANSAAIAGNGGIEINSSNFTGTILVSNNNVTNTNNAFAIRTGNDMTGKDIHVNNNSFNATNTKAIYHGGTGNLDATCNWYGSVVPATIAATISGPVTFTPFLNNGTDNDLVSPGFQPVPGSCSASPCLPDNVPPDITLKTNLTVYLGTFGNATISPNDVVESVTDNCGVQSVVVNPLNFSCSNISINNGSPQLAYASSNAQGNQGWQGELGMEFRVNNAIVIKQLGAFDHQGNGINGKQGPYQNGIRVAIFDKATQTIVPGLDELIVGNADTHSGNHRMKNLTPVNLAPGHYVLVAKGYNANELNGTGLMAASPTSVLNSGGGAISFMQSWYSDNNPLGFTFPQHPYPGSPNIFHAGTFAFENIIQNNTVTVTATDVNGNISDTTVNIAIIDNIPPVIVPKTNVSVQLDATGHATISQTDVIFSLTDNCGVDVSSVTVNPSIFSCSNTASASNVSTHQAYKAQTNMGNQVWQGEMGMEFKVNDAGGIWIKQLGTFDHQGNGINGTISGGVRVAVFNKVTQTIVPGLDAIVTGNADSYTGSHRMKNITPIFLIPGNYVIVAKGYNTNEWNGNHLLPGIPGLPFNDLDGAGGSISFLQSLYSDNNAAGFSYPQYTYPPLANVFLAGTFLYDRGGSSNNTVIITAKDVHGNMTQASAIVNVTDPLNICAQPTAYACGSGLISGIPANSPGYAYNIFTAPTNVQSVIITATVKWDNDWHIPGPNDNTNSYPNLVEIPYLGGNGCDNIYDHTSNKYVELGALNPADQFATITRSLTIGPGKSVAIAGSDCGLSDNISFSQVVTWEATCIPLIVPPTNLYVNNNSIKDDIKIYPNPTSGGFTVQLNNLSVRKVTIQIMDQQGKLIGQKQVGLTGKTSVLTVPFNISDKAQGMYFVKVISADGVQISRVVLQR